MAIIELPVDEDAVPIYESIPEEYRHKIGLMVSLWLKELHGSSPERLLALMSQIGENAQSRGLTPEILNELLDDDDETIRKEFLEGWHQVMTNAPTRSIWDVLDEINNEEG
jgi:hypothetical protein